MATTGTGNQLLDRLPNGIRKRLEPSLEMVPLPQGHELCRQEQPMSHVFFPMTGVCSVVSVTEDGRVVEAATVGKEGMIGIPVVLGLDFSPIRALSQVSGQALRVAVPDFLQQLEPAGPLDKLLRRYVAFSMREAHQLVACNALHSVEERLCRWLLMTHDRVGKAEFRLTQEFLAEMLGVRRQTVTVIAGTLQAAGLFTYRRGVMRIVNRESLEAASCECYQTARSYYERIVQ